MTQFNEYGLTFVCSQVILLFLFLATFTDAARMQEQLGIVVDAGSSGSRAHLYYWVSKNQIMEKQPSCQSKPGLTQYEGKESESATEILTCLNTKEPFTSYINRRCETKFYLGATAGMRMLSLRNPSSSENIFTNIRQQIKGLNFITKKKGENIRIISGAEEGYCAWVSVNYINGFFSNPSSQESIGALDLGGASTQISFNTNKGSTKYKYNIQVFEKEYFVFSYSLLCYGRDQIHYRYLAMLLKDNAFKETVDSPCGLKDDKLTVAANLIFNAPCTNGPYATSTFGEEIVAPENKPKSFNFVGKGDYEACESYIRKMLTTETVKTLQSDLPPLTGKFYGFSSFYYTAKGLNLLQPTTKSNYRDAVKAKCNEKLQTNDENVKRLCFDGLYQFELLSAYGFNDENWQSLEFIKKVKDTEVNWALGFMITHMSH